jgi:Flp pilus assembly protein TadG
MLIRETHRGPTAAFGKERDRGMVLVWAGIFLGVLLAFVGLALDTAFVLLTAHQLQNAADAASLAGAQLVRVNQDDARQLAHDIGFDNTAATDPVNLDLNAGNDPAGDIVLGRYDRDLKEFDPESTVPNAVKVVARKTDGSANGALALIFAPIYGVDTSDVARSAIAMVGGGTGAGIIALNPTADCSLRINGTVTVHVNEGAVQVDSSSDSAACSDGAGATLDAPELNVVGGADPKLEGNYEGDLNEGAPYIPDPLAWLPEPAVPTVNRGTISKNSNLTIQPGYYPTGITRTGGTLTIEPGLYYLDGDGFNISGGSIINAQGTTFFVHRGPVDIAGTGSIVIRPPDPTIHSFPEAVTYEGISFFHGRDNTAKKSESRIIGTSLLDLEGTLYFPSTLLEVGGTGDGFGNQLIADRLWIHGTGEITLEYDGRFPAPGNKVFLVE